MIIDDNNASFDLYMNMNDGFPVDKSEKTASYRMNLPGLDCTFSLTEGNEIKRLLLLYKEIKIKDEFADQSELETALAELFNLMGLAGAHTNDAATMLARGHFEETYRKMWRKIPTYAVEKADRNGDWDPLRHYSKFWSNWVKDGVLFQDQMREYDEKLIDAIRSHCQRNGKTVANHLPPPISKRIGIEIGQINTYDPQKAMRLRSAANNRRHRNKQKISETHTDHPLAGR